MNVVILGCGPAGLFAAQAFAMHGIRPVIISKKEKSFIYGAQYLHKRIPGLGSAEPDGFITEHYLGAPRLYARRVYGDYTAPTSWSARGSNESSQHPIWDLRKVYDEAWKKFEPSIVDAVIDAQSVRDFELNFDVVISTIPLWSICEKPSNHRFISRPTLFKQTIERGNLPADLRPQNSFVVYNGTAHGYWMRMSCIFGHESTEAPASQQVLFRGKPGEWQLGYKVIENTCDCHSNVVRAGRMGRWHRGILSHDGFNVAVSAISERHSGLMKAGS